jgi:hypothetical protein
MQAGMSFLRGIINLESDCPRPVILVLGRGEQGCPDKEQYGIF